MAVTLKTLIKTAPFSEERKKELFEVYSELDDNQKMRLSVVAWTALSQMYFGRLEYEKKKILLEVQEGKRKYNPNDFEEIKAKLLHDFAQKLESAETEESVEEVREQLEKYLPAQAGKTKPLVQDKKDFAL